MSWFRKTRPRSGVLTRADGIKVPLRFHDVGDGEYEARTKAGDEVPMRVGDSFTVDVIGPGQSVIFNSSGSAE